jgi:hypothetical protein
MGNIVWLASYPKSGNTWLRAFIHNLLHSSEQPSELDAVSAFFESEAEAKWYEPYLQDTLTNTAFDQLAALRPIVHRSIANSVARGSVMTKTHNQFANYQGTALHNLEVTAAAIYILRNPLDVVISAADHFGLSIDEAIEFMRNPNTATQGDEQGAGGFLGSWSQHVESWTTTASPHFLVLRYEDMLDKPVATFMQVAKLLGLGSDKAKIKRAIKFASFRELKKQEMSKGFSERSSKSESFFRQGKKHQWIERLNQEQVITIIEQHREQMLKYDYVPPKFR